MPTDVTERDLTPQTSPGAPEAPRQDANAAAPGPDPSPAPDRAPTPPARPAAETDPVLDLDAIEARANAATAGPWTARHRHVDCTPNDDESCGLGLEIDGPPEAMLRGQFERGADAVFIAHARHDVPALVAEVRRLRTALAPSPAGAARTGEDAFTQLMHERDALLDVVRASRLVIERYRLGGEHDITRRLATVLRPHGDDVASLEETYRAASVRRCQGGAVAIPRHTPTPPADGGAR